MNKEYGVFVKRDHGFILASSIFDSKEEANLKRIDMQLETNDVLITREL